MGCFTSKNANNGEGGTNGTGTTAKQEVVEKSFKVVLLGAGESGKSTMIKQLKSIYKIPMNEQDINTYRVFLHNNTATCMRVLVTASENWGYQFNEEEMKYVSVVKEISEEGMLKLLSPKEGEAIAKLWQAEAIQQAFARRNEFWILDSADYYFTNVERFTSEEFIPTEEDCIMARTRTTGIVETRFSEGPAHFQVLDVAGQKAERKKWAKCLDNIQAVVFVVALSGYNQVMFEDSKQNRMVDELNLFETIVNNPIFENCPIILFLNKKDIFEKMISESSLTKCFPDYSGSTDVKDGINFVKNEFEKRAKDKSRLFTFVIAARYKKDVKDTWKDLTKILLNDGKLPKGGSFNLSS